MKRILVIMTVSVAAIAAIFGITVIAAQRVEHRAESCLADLQRLSLGQSTFADLVRLQERYRTGKIVNRPECDPTVCDWTVDFNNNWLHRFLLAPETSLTLGIGVQDNHVIARSVTYQMYVSKEFLMRAHVYETIPNQLPDRMLAHMSGPKNFKIAEWAGLEGEPVGRAIFMNTGATPDQRRSAYAINLHCLSKIGGCDPSMIVPPVLPKSPPSAK